jgi:hypothetical protein
MKTENCDLVELDWSELLFDAVMAGAEAGIEDAQKELEKRQELFEADTISAKALTVETED